MKWFKINGKEYNVRVFTPQEDFTILYSENTGRTLDDGAPIVLDPLGTFFNYTIMVGAIKGKEDSFEELWEFLSTPRSAPILVKFPKGRKSYWETTDEYGEVVIGFYAYVSSGSRKIKKIIEDVDGELKDVQYDTVTIKFIATKAQVLPLGEEE